MSSAQHFLKNRLWILDIVRGMLILLMTLSHSLHFLYADQHYLFDIIRTIANYVCFVGLLFISGSTAALAYLPSHHPHKEIVSRVLKRLSVYILGYYLLAIFIELVRHHWQYNTISYIDILTFNHLVPFTEFIITFILLGLLKIPFRPISQIVSKSFLLTLILSLMVSLLGWYLYTGTDHWLPSGWQALLYGHPHYYSFPLLQYLPIYLLGMYWSRSHAYQRNTRFFLSLLFSLLTLGAITSIYVTLFNHTSTLTNRWPPEPGFLAIGFASTIFILWIINLTNNLQHFPWTRNTFLLFGQNAFAIFFTHTLILYTIQNFGYQGTEKFLFTFTLWGATILLSVYLAKVLPLNYSFGLTFIKLCDCELHQCQHTQERQLVVKLKQLIINTFNLRQIFSIKIANRTYPLLRKRTLLFTVGFILLSVSPLDISDRQMSQKELQTKTQQLQGTVTKQWILTTQPQSITYSLEIPDELTPTEVTYLLNGKPQGNLTKIENRWTADIASETFNPGNFKITAKLQFGVDEFATQPTNFYVSAPLLVAWTIDWEGYDSRDEYLQAIENLASKYRIPVTQLFNPRIYTTDTITPERAQQLTDWVIGRREYRKDEIGLHLHMHSDWISDTGLPFKSESAWGGGFSEGYDVLTSAYTYDEMVTMINRAKYWFEIKNLGTPTSYRAGGWFANMDTLKALNDTGFLVDSSGRTSYTFGTNRVSGHWFLPPTAQPYHPSIHNQNDDLPAPRLKLLEIPNNGADDYAFSAEQMIERFDTNFNREFLAQPRQITYLTHPNWFTPQRQANMAAVFAHIDQWNQKHDRGPVVFATLNQIHNLWTSEEK